MRYRRFGKTEMLLSVFSLGAMRYLESAENAHKTILRALEVGINHIETAQGYGKSEEFIGKAMRNGLSAQRDRFYLTTKISPTKNADSMRRQIEQSLKKLNVDYIDNFDIHGINLKEHLDLVTNPNGCMKAVREAIDQKMIGHVGFSTHAPLDVILDTINTDLFES
ncbi:MAG: aldo/keto reductase, partial [Pseudanabaena sp. CAN_BIN31]|nr:aldo/keto reductase [Pseudanabaena sp. CAN_BIN31]